MTGLDTTVLVAHELREAPNHQRVRVHIARRSAGGGLALALAPQVLHEFVHVVTDARRFASPLVMDEALRRAQWWWTAAEVTRCHPGDRAWELTCGWMLEFRLGRRRVLDTALAAAYHEHGVRRLATANPVDFAVFKVFEFEDWALL
jgi:predicted nucleic acid-binding protein